jgi:hypothetical protein
MICDVKENKKELMDRSTKVRNVRSNEKKTMFATRDRNALWEREEEKEG